MPGVLLGGKPGAGYQDQCYGCIFQEIDPELSGGAFAQPPVEFADASDGLCFIFFPVDQFGDCECILGAGKFLFGLSWKNAVFSVAGISPEKYLSNLSFMAKLFVSILKTKVSEVTTKGK